MDYPRVTVQRDDFLSVVIEDQVDFGFTAWADVEPSPAILSFSRALRHGRRLPFRAGRPNRAVPADDDRKPGRSLFVGVLLGLRLVRHRVFGARR